MINLSSLSNKSVSIAGASGLIGSHMVASLCGTGATVYELGHEDWNRMLPPADIVIHAAGYAQPARFVKSPIETLRINTETTIRLLQSLNPGGSFLFCSSSEVYSGLRGQVDEAHIGTTTPQHPRGCYIEAKRCGEAIVNAYRAGGVSAKSARICLTYGPGTKKHDSRALNSFVEQALTTGVIRMKYSGKEPRTFCYIDDTVEMLWQILLHGKHDVYNIGGVSHTNMAEIAAIIANLTNATLVAPTEDKELPGAPPVACMSLQRIQNEFGKRDFISLEEGLRRTINFQRELYR